MSLELDLLRKANVPIGTGREPKLPDLGSVMLVWARLESFGLLGASIKIDDSGRAVVDSQTLPKWHTHPPKWWFQNTKKMIRYCDLPAAPEMDEQTRGVIEIFKDNIRSIEQRVFDHTNAFRDVQIRLQAYLGLEH